MALAAVAAGAPPAFASTEKVRGIVERVSPEGVTLDSISLKLDKDGRVTGDVKDLSQAKVGFWAEAEGRWTKGGLFETSRLKMRRDAPGASYAESLTESSLKEAKKLDGSDKIYKNAPVTEYVRKVGMTLVPDYAWGHQSFSFEVIRDPSLNAFAMPSGAIYVHTGLLARLENEAQLATVLGHEISHVTQKHGQRHYKASVTAMIPAQIGAIVLGVELQRRTDNPLQQLMVGLGLQLGLSAAVNGYGRTLEDQADRVGLRYAVEAGYDPAEAPVVWDIFNDTSGDEGKIENFFYGNHATNAVRKENLETEIQRHYQAPREGDAAGAAPSPPPARIVNEEAYQATTLDLVRDNAVEDYNLKRYRLASKGFDRVLRHRPGDPVAHHYTGLVILATDEGADAKERALAAFVKALSLAPDYAEAHRDLGFLYASMSRPADARGHLQRYLDLAPADAKDRKDVEKALRKLE